MLIRWLTALGLLPAQLGPPQPGPYLLDMERRLRTLETARQQEVHDPDGRPLTDDRYLQVPSEFPTVDAALEWLEGKRILSDTIIEVEPAHCGTIYQEPIVVDHPDGVHITIASETQNAHGCSLQFEGSSGLRVPAGRTLGHLTELHLYCVDGTCEDGVVVEANASLSLHGVIVSGFARDGVHAVDSGSVVADGLWTHHNQRHGVYAGNGASFNGPGSRSEDNGIAGFEAEHNATLSTPFSAAHRNAVGFSAHFSSVIHAPDSEAHDNRARPGSEGNGALANYASYVELSRCSLQGNQDFGAHARMGSTINVESCSVTANEQAGLWVESGSMAWAHHATVSRNGDTGIVLASGSHLWAHTLTLQNNGRHGVDVDYGSSADLNMVVATSNVGRGVSVVRGSTANVAGGRVADNGSWGLLADTHSSIHAVNASFDRNGGGAASATWLSLIDMRQSSGTQANPLAVVEGAAPDDASMILF